MQPYFEKEFLSIEHDKRNAIVVMKWKSNPTSEEYRLGLNTLLFAMQQFKTGRVIMDTVQLGEVTSEDRQWSASTWTNMAVRSGYSHQATIVSAEDFSKLPAEDVASKEVGILLFATFDNHQAAHDWMNTEYKRAESI